MGGGILRVQSEGRRKHAEAEQRMAELNGDLKKARSQVPQ